MSDFEAIKSIKDFKSMVKYLRTDLGWPIEEGNAENLTFEYTPEELGLDEKAAVKIEEIKQIKPLVYGQPWGIFWIEFESKRLPVTVMRRILAALVKKKRGSSKSDQATWEMQDLMFISATGEENERGISFAHFHQTNENLPQLRTFYWDANERHFYYLKNLNLAALRWPADEADKESWREQWSGAFTSKHRDVITRSHDLAVRMAELASATRDLVIDVYENEVEKGPLHKLFISFKELLIHDLEVDDFADMYAQTITYGLFSAAAARSEEDFNLDHAVDLIPNTNPFLRDLLEECLRVGSQGHLDIAIDELGVGELVTVLGNTDMDAVIQDFGRLTGGEDPVIHFYETFLKEYDAKKKIQRGVFYTPRPVVSYIVRSVDELLRTEFGLEDGLADTTTWGEMPRRQKGLTIPEGTSHDQTFVQILDPATGTGTFLVEVIDLIHKTLVKKWKSQDHGDKKINKLWNNYVPKHLLPRLHGYELLMAPYAIAHLKIGLKLYATGYRFGSDERARVYLTNSLEPASDVAQMRLKGILPALAHEAQAVNEIKRDQRFTVVIGNPPYAGHSANENEWIAGLLRGQDGEGHHVESYFEVDGHGLNERNPKWLNDDYVKFTRLGHWLIEGTGSGVLGFITNHGYLDNPTFRGMRQSLITDFDHIHVLDLHGSLIKKEVTPDGNIDENVFDIRPGVAIFLAFKCSSDVELLKNEPLVLHSDLWGQRDYKYQELLSKQLMDVEWVPLTLQPPSCLFVPRDVEVAEEYQKGWELIKIFPTYSVGLVTARDHFTIHWSPEQVWEIVNDFIQLPAESARNKYNLRHDVRDWKVHLAQSDVRSSGPDRSKVVPIQYRPFDKRFTYYTGHSRGFICMPRSAVMTNMLAGRNLGLISARSNKSQDMNHFFISEYITEAKCGESTTQSCIFPLYLSISKSHMDMLESNSFGGLTWREDETGRVPNLEAEFVEEISGRLNLQFIPHGTGDLTTTFGPDDILFFIYGILHSITYRDRYSKLLKLDYPRIPLITNLRLFTSLICLGADLVGLHILDDSYHAASWNQIKQDSPLEHPITSFVEGVNGQMIGKLSKSNCYMDGRVYIDTSQREQSSYFDGVPEDVWNFEIGGYQVCHKWLYDRRETPGQPGYVLTEEDIAHYQRIVVAIKETIRIMGEIDVVIEEHGGWPDAFAVGEEAKGVSEEKVIPFPLPDEADEAEQRPMRKAAEPGEEYNAGEGE